MSEYRTNRRVLTPHDGFSKGPPSERHQSVSLHTGVLRKESAIRIRRIDRLVGIPVEKRGERHEFDFAVRRTIGGANRLPLVRRLPAIWHSIERHVAVGEGFLKRLEVLPMTCASAIVVLRFRFRCSPFYDISSPPPPRLSRGLLLRCFGNAGVLVG